MRSDLWIRAGLVAAMSLASACDSGGSSKKSECKDDATQSCACDAAADGEQTCKDGKFGACVCGGGKPDGSGEELGNLKGRVFDADTGRAIESAELKAKSGATAKSDATGNFELDSDKDPEEVIVSAKSYAPTVKRPPEKGGYMELFIKDVDKEVDFDADDGVKVKLDSGSSLDIPPGAVIDAEKKRVSGMVKLTIAEVNGAERKQASALPGDLKAKEGNAQGRVAPGGAMEIKLVDKDGKELSVSAESKTVADFSVKDADGAGERRGFTFNEKDGVWELDVGAEGKVKKTLNDEGKPVYRKNIDHLSWHAYGDFFTTITCLRVCVQDGDKQPLAGAQVWMVGSSFPGVSTLFTGDDGCASGDVPTEQEVVLVGQIEGGVSKAARYKSGTDVQSAEADPSKCDDGAEPLVIGAATPSSCPAGFEECDGACADLGTDTAHCGACGNACGGTEGREEACIAGACGCPDGTTLCGTACADLATDAQNCGKCGNDVTKRVDLPAQQCVDGKPQDIACQYPLAVCGGVCIDPTNNEAYCGYAACGTACAASQVCLGGSCKGLNDPYLCTTVGGMAPICETDTSFCNGTEVCDPSSNLADSSGCVRSGSPCAQGAQCDEQLDMCSAPPACAPTTFATQFDTCGDISVCLTTALVDIPANQLANAINCGTADMTAALMSVTDELGRAYDCESCVRNDLMICGRNYGCKDEVDALDCCIKDNKCADQACIQQQCASQFAALDTCFQNQTANSGRCYDFIISTPNCDIL